MPTQEVHCMFCGTAIEPQDLSREHFVPKCLWEKGTRPSGMKTQPAHSDCNSWYSDHNEYFRDILLMGPGVDGHPVAKQLLEQSFARKLKARPGAVFKNLTNLKRTSIVLPSGIIVPNQPTYEVDLERVGQVLKNIVKGIFYTSQRSRPMPVSWHFQYADFAWLDEDVAEYVQQSVSFMCGWQGFGDSAFACRYVVSHAIPRRRIACVMQFYENKYFFAEAFDHALASPT